MRILVTGATGFLGGHVARRLKARGHDVVATGRDLAAGARLHALGIPFVAADLAAREQVHGLAKDCECVVHSAALSSPWGPEASFVRANVTSTDHLLDELRRARVRRLVHISTPSVYMGSGSRLKVREEEPLPPFVNAYARTKWLSEKRVMLASAWGLEAIALRPRALFGPGDTTIFPRLVRALSKGRLPIIGSGDNIVDLTYIDNAVDAVELACHAGLSAVGQVYNISNGEPVPLWSVVGKLSRALGYAPPRRRVSRTTAMAAARLLERGATWMGSEHEPMLTRYSVRVLSDSMTLDISKARRLLGYAPKVSIDEGLERFVHSLRETP